MSSAENTNTPSVSEANQRKTLPYGILNALDDAVKEKIPWIIEKLLSEGEQMLVFGAPKVGKSQFALQLAMCVALGEPFLDWSIIGRRRVLYLNFEMGKRTFMLRIARHYSRLIEERKKRECVKMGKEYTANETPWHESDDEVPPGSELLQEINESIQDHLFFCSDLKSLQGDHIPKPENSTQNAKGSNSRSEDEASKECLVHHWQSVINEVKPDLVIIDTLSKTHSINESDNSEIQQVLLRIRQICSIPVAADDESQSGARKARTRKDIAHIIVHHARKSPGEFSGKGNYLTLDNIRGGSAIRAEADLICGIFPTKKGANATHEKTNRVVTLEARNLPPDEKNVYFETFAFVIPQERSPEKEEAKDDILNELIKGAFVQSKMRGLMIRSLQTMVRAGLVHCGRGNEFSENGLETRLKYLARHPDSQFEIRVKAGAEKQTSEYPHERKPGKILFWIKDRSPWLDEKPLKDAIEAHQRNLIGKSGNGKNAKGRSASRL